MPYKANEARRHKIPRARYKLANWPEHDRALQQRGSLTVWMTPEALAAWHPPRTGRPGRSPRYAAIAIETGHLLRLAFGRPRRQTEGLLRSLATLLGVEIGIPDHTTFSRRSPGLVLARSLAEAQRTGPVHVVIDTTGLKVHGAGEWLAETHGERGRRTWRKRHLAVDPRERREPRLRADHQRGGRCRPGRPAARADRRPHRLGHGRWRLRWRTGLPRRGRAPAPPARGGDHPAPRLRRGKPDRRHHAQSARPAPPDAPDQGTPGLAKVGRLRPALARGDRRVPLQDHHRSWPSRSDSAQSAH